MAVTHFIFTVLPDSNKVVSNINGVAIQINTLYPIADQSAVSFHRTSAYETSAVAESAKYKTYDEVAQVYSNEAAAFLQWGEPTTDDGSTSGGGGDDSTTTTYEHLLGFGATANEACTNSGDMADFYYTDADTFDASTQIYDSPDGSVMALAGFYSDGVIVKEWDGTSIVGSSQMCSV